MANWEVQIKEGLSGEWTALCSPSLAMYFCDASELDLGIDYYFRVRYIDDESVPGVWVEDGPVTFVSTVDILTAQSVVSGQPIVSVPTVGQVHTLSAQNVATDSPIISAPILVAVSGVDILTGQNVSTFAPSVLAPSLSQIHVLGSDGVALGALTVNQPTLTAAANADQLFAQNVDIAAPAVTGPTLAQTHGLAGLDVAIQPAVDTPVFCQIHLLVGQHLATPAPFIASPALSSRDIMPTPRISLPSRVALSITLGSGFASSFMAASSVCKAISRKSSTGMNVDTE